MKLPLFQDNYFAVCQETQSQDVRPGYSTGQHLHDSTLNQAEG